MAIQPAADTAAPESGPATPRQRLSPQVRRVFGFIAPVNFSIYLVVGAVPGVLLPLQVQGIDESNKASNLAIIAGVGAVAAMIASPVAGLLSDRTRSRFGRRAPWLLGGTLATGLSLIGMGFAHGVAQLVVAWTIVQIALNLVISPLTALLPDRVPPAVRGSFATLSGIGLMFGALGGQVLGATFADNIRLGYLLLPGGMLVAIALFLVFCPDPSSRDQRNDPFSLTLFLKTFWVSPRQHPDFFWGFLSRLTLFTGYFLITGYQLYILQDHIGLGDDAVGKVALLGGISLAAIIVSTSVSGPLSDRLGRRKVFVIAAAAVMGVAMLAPLLMPTLTGMIIFTVVCGLGFGVYQAVDSALMSEVLPSADTFAKDLGVLNIAATLPQTIGPFLGGAIVVGFGYSALFPVGLVFALIGALAIVPIKSVR
ncbi:MFS transporter [Streptomyces albipurpureus]|uniref:MFS transporter n=1 Tax=Streptomyces albipurpureus TaxID=2897419 RepID=A0ABT0UFV6_9ACTN|nr:MFS transporter [Streptomyces sp. CWNU-1]MCM2387284.1 MFS transporter [Streptomyces sp. CWNU-1]